MENEKGKQMRRTLIIVFISLLSETLPNANVALADVRVDPNGVVVTDPMAGAGNNKDFEIQREAYSQGVEQLKHGDLGPAIQNLGIAILPILFIIFLLKR